MNYTGPKAKLSRKLGVALTPRAAKVMQRKPYPPGQHGQSKSRKASDYKRQLMEKQRLRLQYNLSERQMGNYFAKAARTRGVTSDVLVQLLEARLDAFVLRVGMTPTIYAARQYVSHGHITVNGRTVNIPSFQLKVGDTVGVKPKSGLLPFIQEALKTAETPPSYIETSSRDGQPTARLTKLPIRDEVPIICEILLVIEYYSR